MESLSITHERAIVASLTRIRPANDPRLIAARRNLAAANLEASIRKLTADAPPLTAEQADHLAALILEGVKA